MNKDLKDLWQIGTMVIYFEDCKATGEAGEIGRVSKYYKNGNFVITIDGELIKTQFKVIDHLQALPSNKEQKGAIEMANPETLASRQARIERFAKSDIFANLGNFLTLNAKNANLEPWRSECHKLYQEISRIA